MDDETLPDETDLPAGDPLAPTPLSLLFPEVTEEEAKLLDGETARIMERRSRVMALYRRGRGMDDIRKELSCSIGTVHHDIHTVLEGFRRIAARTAAEHVADMLQRLAHRERQIEEDLDRSRGDLVETTTGKRTASRGDQTQAVIKKKTKYGDPKLHSLLQGYWDRRCRILGLLKADDFKANGIPPVKLVAGTDPVEAV